MIQSPCATSRCGSVRMQFRQPGPACDVSGRLRCWQYCERRRLGAGQRKRIALRRSAMAVKAEGGLDEIRQGWSCCSNCSEYLDLARWRGKAGCNAAAVAGGDSACAAWCGCLPGDCRSASSETPVGASMWRQAVSMSPLNCAPRLAAAVRTRSRCRSGLHRAVPAGVRGYAETFRSLADLEANADLPPMRSPPAARYRRKLRGHDRSACR